MKKVASILCMLLIVTMFGGTNIQFVNAETKVNSIEIKTLPDKCAYNVGDGYSTKGMVVVAKLSNGKKETVDNSKITSFSGVELTEGRAFTQEGWKSVEIQYKGVKTTYGIAIFDPSKEYTISYDSDGGSKVESKKIDASTKGFKFPEPTKKGYVFLGWYHSNGQKYTKYQQGMGPSLQFKAKWGSAIVFNANGGSGKMKNGTVDKDYKLPKSGFKKSGYKFVGWSTLKKATNYGNFYEAGESAEYLSGSKGNVTLYAQWVKPVSYKISYVSVKGAKIPAKAIKKYTAGKKTQIPAAIETGDKNFSGWKITVNGKSFEIGMEIPPYITGNIKLTPNLTTFEG